MRLSTQAKKIFSAILLCGISCSVNAKEDKPMRHYVRIDGSTLSARLSPSELTLEPNKTHLIIIKNNTSKNRGVALKANSKKDINLQISGFVEQVQNHYIVDDKGEASVYLKVSANTKVKFTLDDETT